MAIKYADSMTAVNNAAMIGAIEACEAQQVRCVEVWHSDALKLIVEVEINGFIDKFAIFHPQGAGPMTARQHTYNYVCSMIAERLAK